MIRRCRLSRTLVCTNIHTDIDIIFEYICPLLHAVVVLFQIVPAAGCVFEFGAPASPDHDDLDLYPERRDEAIHGDGLSPPDTASTASNVSVSVSTNDIAFDSWSLQCAMWCVDRTPTTVTMTCGNSKSLAHLIARNT